MFARKGKRSEETEYSRSSDKFSKSGAGKRRSPAEVEKAKRERLAALSDEEALSQAKRYCVWLLSRRECSAKELQERMDRKGYLKDVAQKALAFCQEHHFQSDERFASSKVRQRQSRLGNRRIQMELRDKGVSAELAAEVLAQVAPEEERALQALSKFEGKPWTPELRSKAWRFLATRGFGSGCVERALREFGRGRPFVQEDSDGSEPLDD